MTISSPERKVSKGQSGLYGLKRQHQKDKSYSEHLMNQIELWTSFYRANPHRFAKDFLNIRLRPFQAILLHAMMDNNKFMLVASRGLGKTFLSAVYLIIRCVLYPDTKVVIASGVKTQALAVINKIIEEIYPNSPLLRREIESYSTNPQVAFIKFRGGSLIKIVAANENSRSARANLLLVDEFIKVDGNIVDTVLKKFLTSPRHPKFLDKPEYADYQREPNTEMYLSSAGHKSHWGYERMVDFTRRMTRGHKFFVSHLGYQLGIKENIYLKEQMQEDMSLDSFSPIKWSMEMEAQWFGESEKAFFSFKDIEKNRREPQCFYPRETLDLVPQMSNPKKESDEVRILSVDIAMLGGHENDATILTLLQLKPSGTKYRRTVRYIESMEGQHTMAQVVRIRQLMEDFDVDKVVLDVRNSGTSIADMLMTEVYDEERGMRYEPINMINLEKFDMRSPFPDAEKKIYGIQASLYSNMEYASNLHDSLQRGYTTLLVKEEQAVSNLRAIKGLKFDRLEPSIQAMLLLPYAQTEALTHEMLNLDTVLGSNDTFTLKEKGRMRKDRYSSLSYGEYYATVLEKEVLSVRQQDSTDISGYLSFRKPKF